MLAGNQQLDVPLLASTVQSVLAQAAAKGMQSVAMPLIGAGRAGWPPKLAAQVHVAQVLKFTGSTGSSLKVIEPVDQHMTPPMLWNMSLHCKTAKLCIVDDSRLVQTAGHRVCRGCMI